MARDPGLLTGSELAAARPGELSASTRDKAVQQSRAVVEISGLGRKFGDHEVVRSLDLSLAPGERVAFWGPNGSGKSTVLRCIAGTLFPSRGRILVNGFPAGTLEARRAVGASLAQDRSFYLRLTGHVNLLFFARSALRLRARSRTSRARSRGGARARGHRRRAYGPLLDGHGAAARACPGASRQSRSHPARRAHAVARRGCPRPPLGGAPTPPSGRHLDRDAPEGGSGAL